MKLKPMLKKAALPLALVGFGYWLRGQSTASVLLLVSALVGLAAAILFLKIARRKRVRLGSGQGPSTDDSSGSGGRPVPRPPRPVSPPHLSAAQEIPEEWMSSERVEATATRDDVLQSLRRPRLRYAGG